MSQSERLTLERIAEIRVRGATLAETRNLCNLAERALKAEAPAPASAPSGPCTCAVVILDGPFVYTPQVPEEAVLKIEYCEWHQGPAAQAAPAPSIEGLTCIRCGNGDSIRPKATLDRTRPEGAYVTQILPGALSAAAGQRPRYKLERVAGDCAVGSITVTEDEARDVLGWLGEYLGPTAITREQVREAVKQGLTHWHPRLEKTTDAIMKLLEAR